MFSAFSKQGRATVLAAQQRAAQARCNAVWPIDLASAAICSDGHTVLLLHLLGVPLAALKQELAAAPRWQADPPLGWDQDLLPLTDRAKTAIEYAVAIAADSDQETATGAHLFAGSMMAETDDAVTQALARRGVRESDLREVLQDVPGSLATDTEGLMATMRSLTAETTTPHESCTSAALYLQDSLLDRGAFAEVLRMGDLVVERCESVEVRRRQLVAAELRGDQREIVTRGLAYGASTLEPVPSLAGTLALAHAQLGESEQARRWLARMPGSEGLAGVLGQLDVAAVYIAFGRSGEALPILKAIETSADLQRPIVRALFTVAQVGADAGDHEAIQAALSQISSLGGVAERWMSVQLEVANSRHQLRTGSAHVALETAQSAASAAHSSGFEGVACDALEMLVTALFALNRPEAHSASAAAAMKARVLGRLVQAERIEQMAR